MGRCVRSGWLSGDSLVTDAACAGSLETRPAVPIETARINVRRLVLIGVLVGLFASSSARSLPASDPLALRTDRRSHPWKVAEPLLRRRLCARSGRDNGRARSWRVDPYRLRYRRLPRFQLGRLDVNSADSQWKP